MICPLLFTGSSKFSDDYEFNKRGEQNDIENLMQNLLTPFISYLASRLSKDIVSIHFHHNLKHKAKYPSQFKMWAQTRNNMKY